MNQQPGGVSEGSAQRGGFAVEINGLYKWFGTFQVLSDINLKVRNGERVVICGPSGSGKSTLIRCINALEDYQRGEVVVEGVPLTHNLKRIDEIRREIGMVFQQFNLFPHLTVLENCTLAPIYVRKMPKSDAERIARKYLDRVRIPEQADKYPGQLSGGQQQRVAIARALCMSPKIMMFDEPTSSLDPVATESIETLIRGLVPRLTVIFVTHNLAQATRVSDWTIFLNKGRLVEHGPTTQVFEHPAEDETAHYVGGHFG